MASRQPGDVIAWARERLGEIFDRAREEGERQAAPYTFREGQGPSGLTPEQAQTGLLATGIMGAGTLPVVGELMDASEIVQGLRTQDPSRAALGFGSLMLPFISAKGLRAYGDIRQSRQALRNRVAGVGETAEEYPAAVRAGAREADEAVRAGARGAGEAVQPRMVAAAALKVKDPNAPDGFRIFTGYKHAEAFEKAANEGLGEAGYQALLSGRAGSGGGAAGFVDRRGNFLTDREAINIGMRSGQLSPGYKGPRNKIPAEVFFNRSKNANWSWGSEAVAGDPHNPIPPDVPLPSALTDDPLEMPRERFNEYIRDLPRSERERLIAERSENIVRRAAEDDPSAMMRIREGTEAAGQEGQEFTRPPDYLRGQLTDEEAAELAGEQFSARTPRPRGDLAERLKEAHFAGKDPGSTINPRTGESMAGEDKWVVSPFKDRERTLDALTDEEIHQYWMENADLLQRDEYYLGSWNNDDGKPVLDVVKLYSREGDALRIGGRADQDGIYHLARDEYRPLTARERADYRREYAKTQAGYQQLQEEMLEGLTPDERADYWNRNSKVRREAVEHYASAPTPRRMTSVALKGAPVKGWYDASGLALMESFGDDAPRFAALTAATSPQKPVDANLDLALETWKRWDAAGRPQDPAVVRDLIPTGLKGDLNNSVRALTADAERLLDPDILEQGGLLSGAKVDPFYANLMGETQRVVNDTHMARGFGTDPGGVGTVARTFAQNALMGHTSRGIEELTGVPVARSNAQEMAWGPIRAATEMSTTPPQGTGEYRTAVDALLEQAPEVEPDVPFTDASPGGIDRRIAETPSFATLLNAPARRSLLESMGVTPPAPRSHAGLGPVDPRHIRSADLSDIGQRIDAVRRGQPFYSMMPWALGAGVASRLLQPPQEDPRMSAPSSAPTGLGLPY